MHHRVGRRSAARRVWKNDTCQADTDGRQTNFIVQRAGAPLLFVTARASLRTGVTTQTAPVPKTTGQRKIGGRFSVNDVVVWVRDSSGSGHCTVARAPLDHREGGLRFFPQPSITRTRISKERYKQTHPDAHPPHLRVMFSLHWLPTTFAYSETMRCIIPARQSAD